MELNSTELATWISSKLLVGRILDNKILKIAPKSFKVCYRATEIMMPEITGNRFLTHTHTHTHTTYTHTRTRTQHTHRHTHTHKQHRHTQTQHTHTYTHTHTQLSVFPENPRPVIDEQSELFPRDMAKREPRGLLSTKKKRLLFVVYGSF
jgi:ABC-type Zn2+ transport system substrate-binding protein/surface adhesin